MAAVVQQNDLVFEFASNVMEDEQQVWMRLRENWILINLLFCFFYLSQNYFL